MQLLYMYVQQHEFLIVGFSLFAVHMNVCRQLSIAMWAVVRLVNCFYQLTTVSNIPIPVSKSSRYDHIIMMSHH